MPNIVLRPQRNKIDDFWCVSGYNGKYNACDKLVLGMYLGGVKSDLARLLWKNSEEYNTSRSVTEKKR